MMLDIIVANWTIQGKNNVHTDWSPWMSVPSLAMRKKLWLHNIMINMFWKKQIYSSSNK